MPGDRRDAVSAVPAVRLSHHRDHRQTPRPTRSSRIPAMTPERLGAIGGSDRHDHDNRFAVLGHHHRPTGPLDVVHDAAQLARELSNPHGPCREGGRDGPVVGHGARSAGCCRCLHGRGARGDFLGTPEGPRLAGRPPVHRYRRIRVSHDASPVLAGVRRMPGGRFGPVGSRQGARPVHHRAHDDAFSGRVTVPDSRSSRSASRSSTARQASSSAGVTGLLMPTSRKATSRSLSGAISGTGFSLHPGVCAECGVWRSA